MPPHAPHATDDFEVLQQAAEWFAVLRAPTVSGADLQRWQTWHGAHPAHADAWARVEAISGKFDHLPVDDKRGARQTLALVAERATKRRRAIKLIAVLGCGSLGSWHASRMWPWRGWLAAHRTGQGERREIRLAEGSGLWLNGDTAVDVDYAATLRRVVLHQGELFIHTQPDHSVPPRPFVVDTRHGRLRALGTGFSVRTAAAVSEVAVFEGAVEIRSAGPDPATRILQAGQQARFDLETIAATQPADPNRRHWRSGLLIAEDIRLADFIAELAHYRTGYLGCAPEVADLKLVGTYALDDTDRILAALEATLPVRVERTLPWWVVVKGQAD